MGRSAKMHKRTSKKAAKSMAPSAQSAAKAAAPAPAPQEQKKRAGLKAKAGQRRTSNAEGPVLGGADYVELMLGGRRKAMEEAVKLPKDA